MIVVATDNMRLKNTTKCIVKYEIARKYIIEYSNDYKES